MMKYYIETFGCQMNEKDSLNISVLLDRAGYQETSELPIADIIIINTCSVRQSAENKITGFIGNLKKYKAIDPNKIIIVCGCMAQKEGTVDKLLKTARHIDMILGTFAIGHLPDYLELIRNDRHKIIDTKEVYDCNHPINLQINSTKRQLAYRAQVNIIQGCNNFCSYCIVPYVRGREKSRKPEDILNEISLLSRDGCKEIELLGQNVNSYGHDFIDNDWNFSRLLRAVNDLDGILRVRYMTSHPRDFTPELLETIVSSAKVCHHFHLPVQSGSDKILKLMNRGYTTKYYLNLLADIRKSCPDAVITSDLIVGFPGEDENDFNTTLEFVKECQFDVAYTFLYSTRSGTKAAGMQSQIETAIKKERLKKLMDLQNPISLIHNQKLIGKVLNVMVEGESKNNKEFFSGRTDGNKIVIFPAKDILPGTIIPIKIIGAKTWNLIGEATKGDAFA